MQALPQIVITVFIQVVSPQPLVAERVNEK